ncbi:MAG TPA: hypothetical protein VK709_09090 [Candidatus Saccharimonadales bacterium]|jgi:hypothetical protein|nr:hypothetical protein [Candidatus Saccharimonadales bacterium]
MKYVMQKQFPSRSLGTIFLFFIFVSSALFAQNSGFERRFSNRRPDLDAAVQQLKGSFQGRLPILEGFVSETNEPLDRYDRGYYECTAQLTTGGNGGSTIRMTAKITAWYTDPTGAQSGYRVLPSNGRIETDLLDRMSTILENQARANSPVVAPPVSPPTPSTRLSGLSARLAPPAAVSTPAASLPSADIDSLRRRREDAEKQAKSLESQVQDLEEILRDQTHPENLAVVRKSGTPVFSQPGGKVLMTSEANDEFELLSVNRDWAHVQISGASRGWIERAKLDMPAGFSQSPNEAKEQSPITGADDAPFHVSRQETRSFSGNWEPLRGKTVLIIWAEPVSASKAIQNSSPDAKRKFASSVFAGAYKTRTADVEPTNGIVIVFDSADGGQIAATMASLAQWTSGQITEQSFWKLCSIDPPDFLQNDEHVNAARVGQ